MINFGISHTYKSATGLREKHAQKDDVTCKSTADLSHVLLGGGTKFDRATRHRGEVVGFLYSKFLPQLGNEKWRKPEKMFASGSN